MCYEILDNWIFVLLSLGYLLPPPPMRNTLGQNRKEPFEVICMCFVGNERKNFKIHETCEVFHEILNSCVYVLLSLGYKMQCVFKYK